jgi:hypothetical protein
MAPFSTGAVKVMRGSPAASARMGSRIGASGDSASVQTIRTGEQAGCVHVGPHPKSSTEIGKCGRSPSSSASSFSSGASAAA